MEEAKLRHALDDLVEAIREETGWEGKPLPPLMNAAWEKAIDALKRPTKEQRLINVLTKTTDLLQQITLDREHSPIVKEAQDLLAHHNSTKGTT